MDAIDRLMARQNELDARLRSLEGGQRSPLAGSQMATNPNYTGTWPYDTWQTILSVQASFSKAALIAPFACSLFGTPGAVFGVDDMDIRIYLDGVAFTFQQFSSFTDGRPFLDTLTGTIIAAADTASGLHTVELRAFAHLGGGAGATHPRAFLASSLLVIPVNR